MYKYETVGRYMISAQDAYVMSDFVRITAPVGGTLTQRLSAGNTHVGKNEIIAVIDGRPVVSNIAGTVTRVFATVGDTLTKGAPLVSIAPDGRAYVVAGFNISRLRSVRSGQPVSIRIDGFPQFRLRGVVAPLPDDRRDTLSTPRGSSHPSGDARKTIRIDLAEPASDTDWLLGLPVHATIDTRPTETAAIGAVASANP